MEPDNRSQARGEALRLWETRGGGGAHPATGKKARKTAAVSEWSESMSEWFRTLLPEGTRLATTWKVKWSECFEALSKLDKRPDDEIVKVCEYGRSDSFWSRNFYTPVKLRERHKSGLMFYDYFLSQMRTAKAEAPALRLR